MLEDARVREINKYAILPIVQLQKSQFWFSLRKINTSSRTGWGGGNPLNPKYQ